MTRAAGGDHADPRRKLLLEIYRAALAAVDARLLMRTALATDSDGGPAWSLAAGKAAATMTLGALDALGASLGRALVVAPAGNLDPRLCGRPGITCMAGGHPLPDEGSLAAGAAAMRLAEDAPPGIRILLLISGGASAVLESLRPGATLAGLRGLTTAAMASAVDIVELNRERGRLSRLKAGGLAGLFSTSITHGYLLSDVPGDDPAVAGSGLLTGPAGACAVQVIGGLGDALSAATQAARSQGLAVTRHDERLAGETAPAARRVCTRLAGAADGLHIWGGELLVRLPQTPGRGGRCQHFALQVAEQIAGRQDILVLAAGTDGVDGASDDAGALVDGGTCARAAAAGHDPALALASADSGPCLEAAGDLVHTGPTGTNVGDLVLALRMPPGPPARL